MRTFRGSLNGLLAGLLVCIITTVAACDDNSDHRHNNASESNTNLANNCFAIASKTNGDYIAAGSSAYRADVPAKARAAAFYLKPTRIGTYLLYDQGSRLLSAKGASVGRAKTADSHAEWAVKKASGGNFTIKSAAGGKKLGVDPGDGDLVLTQAGPGKEATSFQFTPAQGCKPFPEAKVGASGKPFKGTNPDGTVSGFADLHAHITSHYRAGGRVIVGETFDRFGIPRALHEGSHDHGDDGGLDVTGNLLRTGSVDGTHNTHGWPTFAGWPVHDTLTHQQLYYIWLKRAWEAGLRQITAMTAADDQICRIEPLTKYDCNETKSIERQIKQLRALQNYIDAQNGGRGKGWFRLVTTPQQARQVIEKGKLAVVIGIESSNLFGCHEQNGTPQCTRADIDQGLETFHNLGVRSLFLAHWFDNAFAGAAPEGGARGAIINIMNKLETGHYFHTGSCPVAGVGEQIPALTDIFSNVDQLNSILQGLIPPDQSLDLSNYPDYPPGPRCNAKGLTPLGRYLVRQMMARHMLIEVDHLSERAREQVLAIAEAKNYPLVSSHTGTGGAWTPQQLKRLYALGGLATVRPATAPKMVDKIVSQRLPYKSGQFYFGVPMGTDTGGFSSLPGPRKNAGSEALEYPFKSYKGNVTFVRQRTGQRVYGLNDDGVAHYGLFADLVADMQRQSNGKKALPLFFRSAEAYLRMWQRAYPGMDANRR